MDNYAYSIFLSSDNKKLGLFYFNKDDDNPRGNYSIFDVDNFNNPTLIFSHRIDECGAGHKFNTEDTKIVYGFGEEVIIREVNENNFEKEVRVNTNLPDESYGDQGLYNIKNMIVEVFYNKFHLFNIDTKEYFTIKREIGSEYCIKKDKILYINESKLKMIAII